MTIFLKKSIYLVIKKDFSNISVSGSYYSTSNGIQNAINLKKYKNKKELRELQDGLVKLKRYEHKVYIYRSTLFYVCLISGIILIIFSLLCNIPLIDVGLILGAVFSFIDGYSSFWSELPNIIRFASLVAALILVIFFAYFKLVKKNK